MRQMNKNIVVLCTFISLLTVWVCDAAAMRTMQRIPQSKVPSVLSSEQNGTHIDIIDQSSGTVFMTVTLSNGNQTIILKGGSRSFFVETKSELTVNYFSTYKNVPYTKKFQYKSDGKTTKKSLIFSETEFHDHEQ